MIIYLMRSEYCFVCEMGNISYFKRNRKLFFKKSRLNSSPVISPVVSGKKFDQFSTSLRITTKIYKKIWCRRRGIAILLKKIV